MGVAKACTKCGSTENGYYKHSRSWCKKCIGAYQKEYYRKNGRRRGLPTDASRASHRDQMTRWRRRSPERQRESSLNGHARKNGYALVRIKDGDIAKLMSIQDGRCAICRRSFDSLAHAVDHDHETGVVRGLLCLSCNGRLGFYERHGQSAQRYLDAPPGRTLGDFGSTVPTFTT